MGTPAGPTSPACCDAWAALPLLFQPGTEWNYARVHRRARAASSRWSAGAPLDEFCAERILEPLGMHDTAFCVAGGRADGSPRCTRPTPDGRASRNDALGGSAPRRPTCLLGGGGLVSTAADYHALREMLRGGGELDGVRLLGPRTVDYMATQPPAGRRRPEQFGRPLFAETAFDGVGFGLGVLGRASTRSRQGARLASASSPGAARPAPRSGSTRSRTSACVFITQLLPSSTHPMRSQLRSLVYQALVD